MNTPMKVYIYAIKWMDAGGGRRGAGKGGDGMGSVIASTIKMLQTKK